MKELLKLPYYLTLALFLGLTACGDDDDDDDVDCDNLETAGEAEVQALTDAFVAAFTEPTETNCQAALTALDDYIDFVEELRPCLSDAQQDELDEALADFEDERDQLSCDN